MYYRNYKLRSEQDVSLFVILTVRDPFNETTANLTSTDHLKYEKPIRKTIHYEYEQLLDPSNPFIPPPETGGKMMLVLTRKLNESIMIGNDIEITVLAVEGEQIKLGINAPKQIEIHRKEIYLAIQQENNEAIKAESNLLSNLSDYFKKK